jgi:hypothetical protein
VTVSDEKTSTIDTGDIYTYAAVPTVTSLEHAAGPTSGGTLVTIRGTDVGNVKTVKFGEAVAEIVSVHSAYVQAKAPPGTGVVDVTVTNPSGTSAATSHDRFT